MHCNAFAICSTTLGEIFFFLIGLLKNSVMPLLVGLAVAGFVWGVIQYFIVDSEDKKKKGKEFMLWGIIALFAIVSVWGLVGILGKTFGVESTIPQIQIKE